MIKIASNDSVDPEPSTSVGSAALCQVASMRRVSNDSTAKRRLLDPLPGRCIMPSGMKVLESGIDPAAPALIIDCPSDFLKWIALPWPLSGRPKGRPHWNGMPLHTATSLKPAPSHYRSRWSIGPTGSPSVGGLPKPPTGPYRMGWDRRSARHPTIGCCQFSPHSDAIGWLPFASVIRRCNTSSSLRYQGS